MRIYATTIDDVNGLFLFDSEHDDTAWDGPTIFSPNTPLIPSTFWSLDFFDLGDWIRYAIGNVAPVLGDLGADTLYANFAPATLGRYMLFQLRWDFLTWGDYAAFFGPATPYTLGIEADVLDPPSIPVLVSADRIWTVGTLTATTTPGATVHAYGIDGNVFVEIGSGIANGAGVASFALDFTLISSPLFPSPPTIVAINASNAAGSSGLCLTVIFPLISPISDPTAISSIVMAADRLSAVITFTGVPAGHGTFIGWLDGAGGIHIVEVIGNGPHTIAGLNHDDSFSPLILGINEAVQLTAILGQSEELVGKPHSYEYKAPHSREV